MKFIILLVLIGKICVVHSLCNTCSATSLIACVDIDKFQFCTDGAPSAPSVQCPNGTVCTSNIQICSPVGSAEPTCNDCGTCNAQGTFACTSYRTFALCYGGSSPSLVNFTCPDPLVCNVDSTDICVDPTIIGIGATCPLTTDSDTSSSTTSTTSISTSSTSSTLTTTVSSVTTPNPQTDPQGYCTAIGSPGRYAITTDTTCKHYVFCVLVNGVLMGNVFECPGSTYFNSTLTVCQTQLPTGCVRAS